jgi:hypothetical protein
MSDEREIARITITRFYDTDGQDLVDVDSDDLNGGRVGVVEALGMLALAEYDITHHEAEE